MKAAVWNEAGKLDVVDRELGSIKPGWVRLRVAATGICGTDLHFKRGRFPIPVGLQPGHEIAGTIDALGEGVALAAGTRVAVEPIIACGQCSNCLTGNYNRCPQGRLLGVAARGGMAELVDVPHDRVYALPDTVSFEVGALAEPLAVCVRATRLAQVGLGDTVVVLGAGSIGLMAISTAYAAGAAQVFVTARYPHQANSARLQGATNVYPNCDALLSDLGESIADAVLETVGGKATTLLDAANVARPGARIAMMGVFDGSPPFPALSFTMKELTLVASYCYGHGERDSDFARAVRLSGALSERLGGLVTHRFELAQINDAFAAALDKEADSIKVQIVQS